MKIRDEQISFIVKRLKEGKQETELGHFRKGKDIGIITES